ncbi:hypothetical protein [Lichenihabitans psoromatis]|uniref:hypothetical protein n=1 Tax=Lichenihabitans psoromatis TaxID=2528642 RepID=UPI0010357750|nr:hypothetical protein [Lichenihabitans psoromatis]
MTINRALAAWQPALGRELESGTVDAPARLGRFDGFRVVDHCVAVAERRELAARREALTLLRRDIAKMIELGLEEGIAADRPAFTRLTPPPELYPAPHGFGRRDVRQH